MRILLDMDEVLADFVGGVARHWQVPFSRIKPHWEPGVFDIVKPLGKAIGVEDLSEEEFWKRTDKPGFWRNLDTLPWTFDLLETVRKYTDDWYVVTSPSRGPLCVPEKQQWLNSLLGVSWFDRMIPTSHKHLLALDKEKPVVLIDDRGDTVDRFLARGGHGILFPRHHNRLHEIDNGYSYVKAELERIVTTNGGL